MIFRLKRFSHNVCAFKNRAHFGHFTLVSFETVCDKVEKCQYSVEISVEYRSQSRPMPRSAGVRGDLRIAFINLRPAGGCLNTPLRFFADSKKTAARSAAGFSPTLSPIFLATCVKVSTLGHARLGHQVRSSDHTLQKNYNRAPATVLEGKL